MSKSSYLKAIYWNRLVLNIYPCMMMKSCLFVSSERSVALYRCNQPICLTLEYNKVLEYLAEGMHLSYNKNSK